MIALGAFLLGLVIGASWRRKTLEEIAEESAVIAYELEADPDSPLNRLRDGRR